MNKLKLAGFLVPLAVAGLLYPYRTWPYGAAVLALSQVIRMRLNKANTLVQWDCCRILHWLSGQTPTNKDYMLYVGAVDATLDAMRNHKGAPKLQAQCAEAVSGMSLYSLNVQTAAGKKGAVELVVDMMKRWPQDPSVQKGGNSGCFMDFSWENRKRFADHGGIEVMLAAIENHWNNSEVVVQSWYGFSSGTQAPNAERFVKAGGLKSGVKCMRGHAKSYRVREEVMQAFRTPLMTNEAARTALADAGYLQDLVDTMHDSPMDYHQISPACANIFYLAARNKTHRQIAHKVGATRVALKALVEYPQMKPTVGWAPEFDAQYTVDDDCLRVLVALSTVCEAHRSLMDANAAEVVRGVLARRGLGTGSASHADFAMQGWGSSTHVVLKLGRRLLKTLEEPCVESEKDTPYEKRDYH